MKWSTKVKLEDLAREASKRFGAEAKAVRVVVAPYRICPLGAHIDHQLGLVTAMAIRRGVRLAYVPVEDPEVRLASLVYPGDVRFRLDGIPGRRDGDWGNFPRGAARVLSSRYPLSRGLSGLTDGRLAEGGLSSSAAIGVACLLALEEVNGLSVSALENILLDQEIENGYLGLRNGILDQSAILLSRRDHLTAIDCRTQSYELIPRPAGMERFAILIAFSGIEEPLVGTDYNRRVGECAEAARVLLEAAGRSGTEPLLGNVDPEEYEEHFHLLRGPPALRAEHFFGEMERVHAGVGAWRKGDIRRFGELVTLSGESSIHKYECGSEPLIDLHDILTRTPGVLGTRFSGAGFRGCSLALVEEGASPAAAEAVRRAYHEKRPALASRAPVLICRSGDGARIVRPLA